MFVCAGLISKPCEVPTRERQPAPFWKSSKAHALISFPMDGTQLTKKINGDIAKK